MSVWWPADKDVQDWLIESGFHSRDWGLLSSALARPLMTLQGQETYPTLWLKLAALLDSVQRNHPLLDGNKRLGYFLVALTLRGNGLTDSHVSNDDWYDLIIETATGHMEVEEIALRLKELLSTERLDAPFD